MIHAGERRRVIFALASSLALVVLNTKMCFNRVLTASPSLDAFIFPTTNVIDSKATLTTTSSIVLETSLHELVTNLPVEMSSSNTIHNANSHSVSIPEKEEKSQPPPIQKPLNILILYPDDMRHDSIGCAGTQPVLTPFLDSLAHEGVRFTQNAVTTSICWVSRATFFTGQYMSVHNSTTLEDPVFCNPHRWSSSWPSLLQQQAGYYVGHSGKWQFYNRDMVRSVFNWTSLHEGSHWYPTDENQTRFQHTCDRSEEDAIDFLLTRPKDAPFALTVAFYAPKAVGMPEKDWFPKNETLKLYENMTIPEPHRWNESWYKLPFFFHLANEARTRWELRFSTHELYQSNMKKYYSMITEVDKASERIVQELKRQGVYDETLIIFTSDNGFFLGEHGLAGKWYPYQESIRVPLIIRDPRMPESVRGTLDDSFTLNVDLASTILGAANIPLHERMQGRDISELYLKPGVKQTWRDEFYYEHMSMERDYIPASSAVVRKDYKYMVYPEWHVEQLFDLVNDPLEFDNVVNRSEYKSLVEQMRQRHDELRVAAMV